MDRFDVEQLLQALTGGDAPDIGEGIVFSTGGWTFAATGTGDTYNITTATSFITNHGWGVVETVAEQKIYFYWFDVTGIDDLASIKLTYDEGGGEFVYTVDMAASARTILQMEDPDDPDQTPESVVPLYLENDQASFTILIQAYDAIEGGGNLLDSITLITGPAARSGIGTSVKASNDEIITGTLEAIAAFDFFTEDDEEAPPVEKGDPILGLRAVKDEGSKDTAWAPDYEDGATQKIDLTGNLQLNAATNIPSGGTMNIYIALDGNELTINASDYEGLNLTFTTQDYVAATILNFEALTGKLIIGAMGY